MAKELSQIDLDFMGNLRSFGKEGGAQVTAFIFKHN